MTILAPFVTLGAVTAAGVSTMKPFIQGWNARGFKAMEPLWREVVLYSVIFSTLFAGLAYAQSGNSFTALILGTISLFSVLVAFSDATVRKVPNEISAYMLWFAGLIALVAIFAPDKTLITEASRVHSFFPRVPTDQIMPLMGFGLALTLAGMLGFIKIAKLSIAKIFLAIAQVGVFLIVYTPLLWAAYSGQAGTYLAGAAGVAIPIVTAASIIWFFSWAVGDNIGGADIKYMYFVALIAPLVIGPGATLWTIMLAMPLQLVAHAGGTLFGWGELRPVRNGPIAQAVENRKAAREGREPSTKKMRRAIAFLPVLTVTILVSLAVTGVVQ